MRNLALQVAIPSHLHSLADLRALDATNAELNSARSIAIVYRMIAHANRREAESMRRAKRAALRARDRVHAVGDYTDEERAWFRGPLAR